MIAALLLWLAALTGAQAEPNANWAPVAQAEWSAATAKPFTVTLRPDARRIPLDGTFGATVTVVGAAGAGVNPLLGSGRGLFMQAATLSGAAVAGSTPVSIPPPPPPVPPARLVRPSAGAPLEVKYSEPARTLFPAAGRYRVTAVLTVVDVASKRYFRAASRPYEVVVG